MPTFGTDGTSFTFNFLITFKDDLIKFCFKYLIIMLKLTFGLEKYSILITLEIFVNDLSESLKIICIRKDYNI